MLTNKGQDVLDRILQTHSEEMRIIESGLWNIPQEELQPVEAHA